MSDQFSRTRHRQNVIKHRETSIVCWGPAWCLGDTMYVAGTVHDVSHTETERYFP